MKRIFKHIQSNIIEYNYAEKCYNEAIKIFNAGDDLSVIIDNPDKLDIFDVEGLDYENIRNRIMPSLYHYINNASLFYVI